MVEETPAFREYKVFVKHYLFGCGFLSSIQSSVINLPAHLLGCLRLMLQGLQLTHL